MKRPELINYRLICGILLVFGISIFGCNKVKPLDSAKNSLILSVLNSTNKPVSSASGPPPYGTLPEGNTPTINGVPNNIMSSPKVSASYQLNLNLFDRFGMFYHSNINFPEIRQITDFSIVKVGKSLEDAVLLDWEFHLFMLDASLGNIIYSKAPGNLSFYTNSKLKNSKLISVNENGRIFIVNGDGVLDGCLKFTTNQIVENSGQCENLVSGTKKIDQFDGRKVIALLSDNTLYSIDSDSFEISQLILPKNLPGIVSFNYSGKVLTIVYNNGHSISSFLDNGTTGISRFEEKAKTNSINIETTDEVFSNISVNSIVRSYEGRYYAYSDSANILISLNPKLESYPLVVKFTPVPIPFYRIKDATRLQLFPNSRLIHIGNKNAIQVFSETSLVDRIDLLRQVPTALNEILITMADSLLKNQFDPRKDLFQYPGVDEKINEELNKLK